MSSGRKFWFGLSGNRTPHTLRLPGPLKHKRSYSRFCFGRGLQESAWGNLHRCLSETDHGRGECDALVSKREPRDAKLSRHASKPCQCRFIGPHTVHNDVEANLRFSDTDTEPATSFRKAVPEAPSDLTDVRRSAVTGWDKCRCRPARETGYDGNRRQYCPRRFPTRIWRGAGSQAASRARPSTFASRPRDFSASATRPRFQAR